MLSSLLPLYSARLTLLTLHRDQKTFFKTLMVNVVSIPVSRNLDGRPPRRSQILSVGFREIELRQIKRRPSGVSAK